MKIGYIPSIKTLLRNSTIRESQGSVQHKLKSVKQQGRGASTLVIDAHTQQDLEIFECAGAKSLYQLCNFTRTLGGAQILKQRMARPFADAVSIKLAQDSIKHVIENEKLYKELSLWITHRVERYLVDPLMFVVQKNPVDFFVGATILKISDSRHYSRILRGVQFTCLFVQSLRRFLHQAEPDMPEGEMLEICTAMKSILNKPQFLLIPDTEPKGFSYLKVLRLDQAFRIYERECLEELLRLVYEIDALVSFANATVKYGYIMPHILSGPTTLKASGLVNPQVSNPIPNNALIDQASRVLFITGPNMAGKTTYLRAIACALYFAHLGMGVPAQSLAFTPVDRLFSSLSISDNVHTGVSYFLAEVLRIKAVAAAVAEGLKVIAIMDEPFKGTNVKDALEASSAIIKRLASKSDCLFLFSSHLIELDEEFSSSTQIKRCHFKACESDGKLRFDYLLHPGISEQRLGMRVLAEQGVFKLLEGGAE